MPLKTAMTHACMARRAKSRQMRRKIVPPRNHKEYSSDVVSVQTEGALLLLAAGGRGDISTVADEDKNLESLQYIAGAPHNSVAAISVKDTDQSLFFTYTVVLLSLIGVLFLLRKKKQKHT